MSGPHTPRTDCQLFDFEELDAQFEQVGSQCIEPAKGLRQEEEAEDECVQHAHCRQPAQHGILEAKEAKVLDLSCEGYPYDVRGSDFIPFHAQGTIPVSNAAEAKNDSKRMPFGATLLQGEVPTDHECTRACQRSDAETRSNQMPAFGREVHDESSAKMNAGSAAENVLIDATGAPATASQPSCQAPVAQTLDCMQEFVEVHREPVPELPEQLLTKSAQVEVELPAKQTGASFCDTPVALASVPEACADKDTIAQSARAIARTPQELARYATENARRILGELPGLAAFVWEKTPLDWADVHRGRDLFVAGWGGFDVCTALETCMAPGASALPSVAEIRSHGYIFKFFSEVQEKMQRERLRRALLQPESTLAGYVVQHKTFWADAAHANRLDEVELYFHEQCPTAQGSRSKRLKEHPTKLLNRLARERAVSSRPLIRFAHLLESPLPVFFSEKGQPCTEVPDGSSFELAVLEDSHCVIRAAMELNNCAADYVRELRQKRCALVVLKGGNNKLLAMGEWDLHDRRWSQISEHSDEPVRSEWQKMFDHIEGDSLFPVRSVLLLPGLLDDDPFAEDDLEKGVSVFSSECARTLESFCNRSGDVMSLACGWPSLLPADCSTLHPEALTALLLWLAASTAGCQALPTGEICDLAERLLLCHADPDAMTNHGWTSLMLAVESQHSELSHLLIRSEAEVNARGAQSGRTALLLAAAQGRRDLAQDLVAARASLNVAARIDGRTALIAAAEAGAWELTKELLEASAGPNARRFDGKTAIMLAVEGNQPEIVQLMAEQRAELDATADNGATALSLALAANRFGIVKVLAGANCDLNMPFPGTGGRSALALAATSGNMEVLELLVHCRATLDASEALDSDGAHGNQIKKDKPTKLSLKKAPSQRDTVGIVPAVAAAATSGQWLALRRLVEHAANPNVISEQGFSILVLAIKAGESSLVEFLSARGASANFIDAFGQAPIAIAASAGHVAMIKALAAAEADLDAAEVGDSGKPNSPALVAAAENKKWAAAQLLIDLRAGTEARDRNGCTALVLAASHGNTKTLCSLIEQKAELEARNKDGQTALVIAARRQHYMAVRKLTEARANLEAIDNAPDAKTAILRVAETSQWDTVIHLARHGASLSVRGHGGRTVLMFAAECGLDDVAWWLLKCRADPDALDDQGETALSRSCSREAEGMMRVLFDGGASIEVPAKKSRVPRMVKLLRTWKGEPMDD